MFIILHRMYDVVDSSGLEPPTSRLSGVRSNLLSYESLNYAVISLYNGEDGIWTHAPLLTTYSLSRGAPSASLGTSPKYADVLYTV